MRLSPTDVEQKTFSTALRGYDLDEVDDFLDEIVATIKELTDQVIAAKEASGPVPVESSVREELPDESAVGRALVAAQETADQIVAEARREAERILKEADTEAETLVNEKQRRRAAAEAEMALLTEHVAGVRTQLAVLATAVADRLDEMDEAIDLPDAEDISELADGNREGTNEGTDEGSGGSAASFETGKHTGVSDQVDITGEVGEFILDEPGAEAGESGLEATENEIAETSERTW